MMRRKTIGTDDDGTGGDGNENVWSHYDHVTQLGQQDSGLRPGTQRPISHHGTTPEPNGSHLTQEPRSGAERWPHQEPRIPKKHGSPGRPQAQRSLANWGPDRQRKGLPATGGQNATSLPVLSCPLCSFCVSMIPGPTGHLRYTPQRVHFPVVPQWDPKKLDAKKRIRSHSAWLQSASCVKSAARSKTSSLVGGSSPLGSEFDPQPTRPLWMVADRAEDGNFGPKSFPGILSRLKL